MMKTLPGTLYTAEQTRLLDRTAIDAFGIPGFTLMKRAAKACFREIKQRWPQAKRITVLCGGGNNGGDGLVIAALAKAQGWQVQARFLGDEHYALKLQGEALDAWQMANASGVELRPFKREEPFSGDIIVDALLGTGLGGDVRGVFVEAISKINRATQPVVAVDIPSGLCADTGAILGVAVRADLTVTFIGLKQGLFMHQAVDCVGEVVFDGLLIPEAVFESVDVSAFRLGPDDVKECLPKRKRSGHKGDYGHLLIIGGDHGMGGAALMAAEAAVMCGAGKVTLATREEHVSACLTRCPEVMVKGVNSAQALAPLLEQATAVVIGPGLGQSGWGHQMLKSVMDAMRPTVVDADALNLMVLHGLWGAQSFDTWVATPHPGEAARLLNDHVADLQSDRLDSAARLQRAFGGTIVLKGAGSIVTDGDAVHLCSQGNPGMGSGGMGDVLSGVIGALLAQKLSAIDAARVGVYAHAAAADQAALDLGERGLKATDLIQYVRFLINHRFTVD